ncbi:MAG: ATP-binding protein [Gemmatimonadaceae bacterium]|nr:ATP-binding protein [Gemmatimonadaceae bacterium]
MTGQALGRVVATERRPNTPHQFHFWTAVTSPVGIGTIVRVDGEHPVDGQLPKIYGAVIEGFSYSDLVSPMHDVLGHDGEPSSAGFAPTERTEIRLYTAAVLRMIPEEPLQPVPMGSVFLADENDVAVALRMDSYLRDGASTGIPIGIYHAGGTDAPIYLDADFLVGPEAAHLNITGVSGLATKTSAVEWLLSSLFTHFPKEKGTIAAVAFNVKGPDLCYLDQPGRIEPADEAMYEKMRVPAKPFDNVRYYAAYDAGGYNLNTLRSNDALLHNVQPLTWGLREVLQYAEVLLNKDDVDAKADAVIDFIRDKIAGREFRDERLARRRYKVDSFAELDEWFRDVLAMLEEANSESYRTHHVATIRKVRNRLTNIALRCAGLVTAEGTVSDLPFGSFEDRGVYVVDVALLEEDAQDLIFTRIVSKLREHLERRNLGVDHVVVFVDELNKYAATEGPETYVRKMLLDIAERGRYLGLVLFGAQQFRSQVHRRVVGNSGTSLFGRMDADELAAPGYAVLSQAIKTKLSTLEKGQLMVRHPHFTQPVFIRFPRPAVMQGREGVELFPQAAEVSLDAAVTRSLRVLDPSISLEWVKQQIALREDDEVIQARNATVLAHPRDVKAFFASRMRPLAPVRAEAPKQRPVSIKLPVGDDPYGF